MFGQLEFLLEENDDQYYIDSLSLRSFKSPTVRLS